MKCFPTETSNKNVPSNSYMIAQWEEGETIYTAYILKNGNIFKVGDWSNDKPSPVSLHMACKLTGMSESMLFCQHESFFRCKK